MRIRLGVCLGILLVPLSLGFPDHSGAATYSGRSGTVLEWYDTAESETAVPAYQYLQLHIKDLVSSGYNFKFYGRLAGDVADEADVDSRLYYAYLEKRNLLSDLDLRLGRQFIATSAGASIMDGLRLDYSFLQNYKLKAFVGGDVLYYEGYNLSDLIDGFELGGSFLGGSLEMNGSYLQKWDNALLAKELIGFDADYRWNSSLRIYNELQWDVISERLSYALLGGKYRIASPLTLRLEYLYSLPVFSSTSIYSVFAVEEYEEFMAELTWRQSRDFQYFARLTHEFYDEFSDADVLEIGVEKLRTANLYGYLSAIYRSDDDGQGMYGCKLYGNYQFLPRLRAGLGVNLDVLERDIAYYDSDDSDQNETTSTRIWLDARYDWTKSINTTAKYEYIESDIWDYYHRGTLRLNVNF